MKLRLFNHSPVTLLVFLFLILAIAATTRAIRKQETTGAEEKPGRAAVSMAESKPATAATNSPADGELARLIDQAIDQSEFSSARWGLIVISRSDGRTLYARNADKLFTPASNMKIYTTTVALDLLGANYQWRTSVYSASQPDTDGVLKSDVTLYGRGAPDLLSRPKKDETASLVKLADELYQRGVRHIRGHVIGDESYFRADPLGDGWQWNDVQWYFGAEPSALSIDDNEVDLQIEPSNNPNDPPVVKLSNAQDYVHLANNMATVKRGEQMTVGIHRGVSDNEVRVWGDYPLGSRPFGARLSIHDPALRAARLFMDALRARGIAVEGAAHTRDFRVPASERFDPSHAVELAYVSSKPLSEVVRATNKESINLNAELILRTLGRERGEIAPDTDPHKTHERGDDEAGLAVIRLWLNRANIPTNNLALHDGSGLSRLDLVTPEATARLLMAISRTASASVFQESLPIAGRDGTLKGRLRTFRDRVSAKTGSLTYDNSLSGFLTAADGTALVFSIICNDQTGRASSTRLIDEIVTILATYPSAKAGNP